MVTNTYQEVKYKSEFNYEITQVIKIKATSDKILSVGNINIVIFRELYVVILFQNYFIHFWVCYIMEFLFFSVNGAHFVCRSSDIWVTGCNYV